MSRRVLVLSDLHFGKKTDAYDLAEADRRVREIPGRLPQSAPEAMHVLLVGDLADGSGIFAYQDTTTDANPMRQVAVCKGALWQMLTDIAAAWPGVPIYVDSVPGNHGRLHPTADPRANWDNQITYFLAERAESCDRIDVRQNTHISRVVSVGDYRIAMLHRAEKHGATNALAARVLRRLRHYRADLLVCGHWHTPGWYEMDGTPILLTNGSLCGPDEYSEQLGAFAPPSQAVLEVGERVTCDWLRW